MNKFYTATLTILFSFIIVLFNSSISDASIRKEVLKNPMIGEVLKVVDGDTVNIKVHVWIGQQIETSFRIDGIDTPEIKGKCEKERSLAKEARSEVQKLLSSNKIRIHNVRLGKYAGRVLGEAQTMEGVDIGEHLISKGLARPYHGKKRAPWCTKRT